MDVMTVKPAQALDALFRSEARRHSLDVRTDVSVLPLLSQVIASAASHAEESEGQGSSIDNYKSLRQLEALVKKNPNLPGTSSTIRREAAFRLFHKSELQCKRSNRRLRFYAQHKDRLRKLSPLLTSLIDEARWDIYKLVGPGPDGSDLMRFQQACNFGRGVSGGLESEAFTSRDVNIYAKLSDQTTVSYTPELLSWYSSFLMGGAFGRDLLRRHLFGVLKERSTKANRVISVPKDADKDRVIAVEPLLNMYIQQGWKGVLTEKLLRWGVTLEDQTRNQQLAEEASRRGFARDSWSTIDLSSASDTVCCELVRWFLPEGWYNVLASCRTSEGLLDGETIVYEKFSSMGNAITFPLQCLLFASIVRAACRLSGSNSEYRVYGDDLIVPTNATLLVLEALKFLGFTPNIGKTSVTGHFRESCGADFFFGRPVRPVYLKKALTLQEVYSFFNRLQTKLPGSPLLDLLISFVKDPVIGPATRDTIADGHFVAPSWLVRSLIGNPKPHFGTLPVPFWCEKDQRVKLKDLPLNYQISGWTLYSWILTSSSRNRDEPFSAYLTSLFGSFGSRHGLRGTSVFRRRRTFHPVWDGREPTWLGWVLFQLG